MRIRTHRLIIALILSALSLPAGVQAQAWLADRDDDAGRGIRLGDLELHPGVAGEFGYQSNVLFDDADEVGSSIMRLSPHLYLQTLGSDRREGDAQSSPPSVSFRGGIGGGVYYYTNTDKISDPLRFSADADLDLVLMPERPFSLGLTVLGSRQVRPVVGQQDPGGAGGGDYGRNQLQPGARVMLQSRGGILKTELGGDARIEWYDQDSFDPVRTRQFNGRWLTTWEFLPKTALFEETTLQQQTFTGDAGSTGAQVMRNSGLLLSSRLGINGAITPELGTTFAVGYTSAFFSDDGGVAGNDYDTVNGQAVLRWSPNEQNRFSLGYSRAISLAYQGNYVRNDRINANYDLHLGGAVLIGLRGSVWFGAYGEDAVVLANSGDPSRDDLRYEVGLNAEYRVKSWLALTANVGYQKLDTDFVMPAGTGSVEAPARWQNTEAWLGLRAFL